MGLRGEEGFANLIYGYRQRPCLRKSRADMAITRAEELCFSAHRKMQAQLL